jgi:predicted nuclease with TOPRIM domain
MKDMNKKQTRISLFIIFLLTLVLGVSTIPVKAEPTAIIYPSEGTIDTDIFLQVRGFALPGDEWDVHYKLYLFWDSSPLMTGVDDGGNHFYDIYFKPPNEHPYSDLGNHTIFMEIWRDHYGWTFIANFTLEFEILEWGPCPEYLALNATYSSLLANYSDLLNDYNSLLADHNTLQANYNTLQNNYNSLLADYNNLLTSYNILANNYDSLNSNYYELESSYENLNSTYSDLLAVYTQLQSNYAGLQGNYDSLSGDLNTLQALYSSLLVNYTNLQADYNSTCSSYHTLEVDYNSLESSYSSLETDYNDLNSKHDTLMSDLGFAKNLSYVFLITTLIFIASTVYLAIRRPKAKPKAKAT